jgi:hypothetical protein
LLLYDLEYWLEDERDLAERNRADQFQVEETAYPESPALGSREESRECFGLKE